MKVRRIKVAWKNIWFSSARFVLRLGRWVGNLCLDAQSLFRVDAGFAIWGAYAKSHDNHCMYRDYIHMSNKLAIFSITWTNTKLELTKQFQRKQCRSCGGKVIPKRVCLDCNEPSVTWCESCFSSEDFLHVGHIELDLFWRFSLQIIAVFEAI